MSASGNAPKVSALWNLTARNAVFLLSNSKCMTQSVSTPAVRLTNEVTPVQTIGRWFCSTNSLCSSFMEEQVTNLQVVCALATFLFLTLAVFTVQKDVLVTVLFLALAAVCSRGIVEKGGES